MTLTTIPIGWNYRKKIKSAGPGLVWMRRKTMPTLDAVHVEGKPLDWVADCADIFCQKHIHFGDRCIIDLKGKYFCNERCFIGAKRGKTMRAGTEEYTI
jgi:hypothetical protein